MLSFYTIVIIIAVILLIGALSVIGITLTKNKQTNAFPEYQENCPDFWTLNGTICSPNASNTPPPSKFVGIKPSVNHTGVMISNDKKSIVSLDTNPDNWSSICDKYKWSNLNGILWDGVSNINTCA
jgi:hypothetical protein